jgi:hypothetical protein
MHPTKVRIRASQMKAGGESIRATLPAGIAIPKHCTLPHARHATMAIRKMGVKGMIELANDYFMVHFASSRYAVSRYKNRIFKSQV